MPMWLCGHVADAEIEQLLFYFWPQCCSIFSNTVANLFLANTVAMYCAHNVPYVPAHVASVVK